MPQIAVFAKLTAAPGQREALVEALGALVDAAADEPGTLQYTLHVDNGDDDLVWFYELYEDEDALAAHGRSDTMREVGGKLAGLLAAPPQLIRTTPRRTMGGPTTP